MRTMPFSDFEKEPAKKEIRREIEQTMLFPADELAQNLSKPQEQTMILKDDELAHNQPKPESTEPEQTMIFTDAEKQEIKENQFHEQIAKDILFFSNALAPEPKYYDYNQTFICKLTQHFNTHGFPFGSAPTMCEIVGFLHDTFPEMFQSFDTK